MSAIFVSAVLTAAGTPQSLASSTSPALPSININGVSSGSGSATQQLAQIMLQADPSNTGANIYIGGRAMVKSTRVGVGLVLPKTGSPVSIGQYGGLVTLDDIYFDGDTTADKLLVTLVG
jgi:hypothetical protein